VKSRYKFVSKFYLLMLLYLNVDIIKETSSRTITKCQHYYIIWLLCHFVFSTKYILFVYQWQIKKNCGRRHEVNPGVQLWFSVQSLEQNLRCSVKLSVFSVQLEVPETLGRCKVQKQPETHLESLLTFPGASFQNSAQTAQKLFNYFVGKWWPLLTILLVIIFYQDVCTV